MNDQDRFTRDTPPPTGPGLDALHVSGAPAIPVFSDWHRREFERSPWAMRIFEHGTFRFLAVNDAAVKLYGYSREEFLAMTAMKTRHPEEHGEFQTTLNEPTGYLRHRGPRRHIRKDGQIIVVEAITQDILFDGRMARLSMNLDITGRLQMQEILWQRQQEFETLAENLPDLVARFDRNHRFVYVNSAVENLSGGSRHNMIGKTQRELGMPDALVTQFGLSLDEAIRTGEAHTLEFNYSTPGGERLFEAYHVPERDASGQVATVLCVARDITERKSTERALHESNEFLKGVIESSRDCIKVLDLESRLQLINEGGRRLLEIDDFAPMLNSNWHEFWRGADHAAAGAALDAARGGGVGHFEGYCPTLKGTSRWWDVVVTPILGSDGKPAKLLAVSRDVTGRRQRQDLQSRLAAIVNNSMDAVISKDLDGVIRTWNPAAERLFGYRAEEIVGQLVTLLVPSERRKEEALIMEHIRNGEPVEPFRSVRCRKDGTRVDVSLSISPIRDAEGKVIGASKIARDITERRQAELAMLRSAALTKLLELLAREANEALTPEAAMVACLERICQYGHWVLGRVAFYHEGEPRNAPSRSVWHMTDRGRFEEFIRVSELSVPQPDGQLLARVLREHIAIWIEDIERGPAFGRRKSALEHGLRSAFAFPVIVRGNVVALMEFHGEQARMQDPLTMGAAQSIASQLARIVEREWASQANARMAAIVKSSHDAIVSRELDGTILTWNPAAERLFGYMAEEIVGRNMEILYPPELMPDMIRRQKALLQGEVPQAYETVRMTKDGRRIHVSTSPSVIRDASGKICGVSTIIRDNTARNLAEQALRESEERFRQLAENIKQIFWINTREGNNILYISPAYEEIWGRSCESLHRNPRSWMDSIHPDDLAAVRNAQQNMARGVPTDVEYRIFRPDGTVRWIKDRSYDMKQDWGGSLVCGIAEDITDQKLAEEGRLIHAIRQRDALVREVHHRIKNNLQGVAGLLRQKIRKYPAVAPGIEEAIVQLQSVAVVYGLQGTRADGLLNLSEMVEAICASVEGLIGGRVKRTYKRESLRPACVAGSEAVSVAVALNELVFNALKHQSAPAGKKRAQVALIETRDAAEIRITNRGRLPKRFDFAASRESGNGLGLVRALLATPGASVQFTNGRNKVEARVSLQPPLLAGSKVKPARRSENVGASEKKGAAAHPGRG